MTIKEKIENKDRKYFFMGGVPRSGSTLLCSILGQNPDIYTSGITIISGILWNNYNLFSDYGIQKYLKAQNRDDYPEKLMKLSIDSYYSITEKKYVIDKSRTWTLPGNKMVLEKYIDPNPKIIVTTRGVEDVFKSLVKLYVSNGADQEEVFNNFGNKNSYGSTDFFKSYAGLMSAYLNNKDNSYFFIDYEEIVSNTDKVVIDIYRFLGIEYYSHNLKNIKKSFEEDDSVWNLKGLHDIRESIQKTDNNIIIPKQIKDDCAYIQKLVDDSKQNKNLLEVNRFINSNCSL